MASPLDATQGIGPEECAWRKAHCAWWEAATSGDWDAEHALRMAQADAWHDLPDQVKVGAWVRWKLSRGEVPEPGTYREACANGDTGPRGWRTRPVTFAALFPFGGSDVPGR